MSEYEECVGLWNGNKDGGRKIKWRCGLAKEIKKKNEKERDGGDWREGRIEEGLRSYANIQRNFPKR